MYHSKMWKKKGENKMGAENKELDEELEDETLDNEGTEDQTDEDTGADDGKGKDEPNEEKTFTQAQVTRMMSKEKKQGKNSVYKELGIDPKDTKMIAMFKAFVNSQKSDEDVAAENKAENDAKLAEAERKALTAELKAEAMMMGVKTQYVEDIVTLAMSKMTDEDADAKVIMGEFKRKYPVWFGEGSGEDDSESTGKKGTGSSVSNKDKNNKGGKSKSLGARLAAQRKQQNDSSKSSFWS